MHNSKIKINKTGAPHRTNELDFYLGKMGENLQTTQDGLGMENISELEKLINKVKEAIARVNNFDIHKVNIDKLEKNLVYFRNVLNKLAKKHDFCSYNENNSHQKIVVLLERIKEEEEKYRFKLNDFYQQCRQKLSDLNLFSVDYSFSLDDSFDILQTGQSYQLISQDNDLSSKLTQIKKEQKSLQIKKETFIKRKEQLSQKIEQLFQTISNLDISSKFHNFREITLGQVENLEGINNSFKTILKQLIGLSKKEDNSTNEKQLKHLSDLYQNLYLWHSLLKKENKDKVYNEDLVGIALP